jgi:hypothetical protein
MTTYFFINQFIKKILHKLVFNKPSGFKQPLSKKTTPIFPNPTSSRITDNIIEPNDGVIQFKVFFEVTLLIGFWGLFFVAWKI